ncbi:HAD family hydrolase [Kitasatospora phosalacinea]|uniref:HAD family hydrolase n=1 Tax=Kitasatospora phosalacinea TaxID=2065 RepID=UPI00366A0E60
MAADVAAALFDVDGTLLDAVHPHTLAWWQALAQYGHEVDAVTDADAVDTAKPAPDLVRKALEQAPAPAERSVFVGDSMWDVQAAGRAGTPSVGVETGGFAAAELRGTGAVEVHPSVGTLPDGPDTGLPTRPRAGER